MGLVANVCVYAVESSIHPAVHTPIRLLKKSFGVVLVSLTVYRSASSKISVQHPAGSIGKQS